jgi:hypothetical protein
LIGNRQGVRALVGPDLFRQLQTALGEDYLLERELGGVGMKVCAP